MQNQINIIFLILASICMALLVISFVIFFLYMTQKRSYNYQANFTKIKKEYETSVLYAQIEIQANTLQEVSDEIHDNIGQRLSSIKMNLGKISIDNSAGPNSLIEVTSATLSEIIAELRHISKSISPRHISQFGLIEAIKYQANKINKTGEISVEFSTSGEKIFSNPSIEIVLFRMVQELVNNAIKHSDCKNIWITVDFEDSLIRIIVKDNGKGFNKSEVQQKSDFKDGTGLHSIETKAKNINCSVAFYSNQNGTIITIIKALEDVHN